MNQPDVASQIVADPTRTARTVLFMVLRLEIVVGAAAYIAFGR